MCYTAHSFHTVGYTIGYILLDFARCRVYTPRMPYMPRKRGDATVTEAGLLRTRDIAKLLNVSTRQVRDMAQKGEIPAFQVSSEWRFDRAEIDRWLDQRRNVPKESGQM